MKTREQVEALKKNWHKDPIWDIEATDGFEEYHDELKAYHLECEYRWELARQKHHTELASKVCPLSMAYIHRNSDDTGFGFDTCQVEKCALWNEPNECCAIRALNLHD